MTQPGVRSVALAALFVSSGFALGCDSVVEPAPCASPEVVRSSVRANPDNVLSAIVTAEVRSADSVAVRFGQTTEKMDSISATFAARDDSVVLPVFALRDAAHHSLQVVAHNRCSSGVGAVLSFVTDTLPGDLPRYTAVGEEASPGYVVFAAGNYGIAIDNTGRVVWYHRFPKGPGLNFQPQPNGRYVARPNPPAGEIGPWVEVDPLGNVTRTLRCARGLQPRLHDLLAQPDGSYWIMCDEVRTIDLSASGGPTQAVVLGTVVQHLSATGDVLFDWSPFDHLQVDLRALEPGDRTGAIINWTHGNAIDVDGDGNLLVSFRNLSEVIKVDTRTGDVAWRMGGARTQFTFENVPTPAFARQHGVRATGTGRLQLLDNLGDPLLSRAERYEYDEGRRTVRQISSYASSSRAVAQIGGTTQSLPGGGSLVSFGNGGSVEEYGVAGNVAWRIEGNPGYVFRAQRIRSLYHPGVGDPH